MKRVLLIVGLVASLSACKSYMVSTVTSTNTPQDQQSGEFNLVNDSAHVKFSFAGKSMPLKVEVYNKLNEPLYVNWERSALVIGDKAYSFVDDNIRLSATVNSSSYDYRALGTTDTYGDMNGKAKVSKNETFIPPGAKVSRTIYVLNDVKVIKVADSSFKKVAMNYDGGSGVTYAKIAQFTETDSPVQFRCFLTLHTLKNNSPQSVYYQQRFYVSGMTKTGINPLKINEFNSRPGSNIINEKTTGFAKAMTTVALIGGTGALIATEQALNDNQKGQ